ncbi:MAG: septal ring lytic transglycosylase RlpA family protein [Bacteroidia bacterium]|nr:septal ring lytic transglycosylase RlpA family protein [Bacteroidia bacterium]
MLSAQKIKHEGKPLPKSGTFKQEGKASFYSNKLKNNKTASGEMYDPKLLTAAHRTLPFQTMLKVTNKQNGKIVIVRVNDRGPGVKAHILDLSKAAALQLGITKAVGIADVLIETTK